MVAFAPIVSTEDCRAPIHHLLIQLSHSSHSAVALVNAADVQLERIFAYKNNISKELGEPLTHLSCVLYELSKRLIAVNQSIDGLSKVISRET